MLRHLKVTAAEEVLGSPTFTRTYAGDSGRRIEGGLRYSFQLKNRHPATTEMIGWHRRCDMLRGYS